MYISQEDVTYCITETSATINKEQSSNQEEANTEVIIRSHHSLLRNPSSKVVLHSPPGDTNILILAASFSENSPIYIYCRNGRLRKDFLLNQINIIKENLKKSLTQGHVA